MAIAAGQESRRGGRPGPGGPRGGPPACVAQAGILRWRLGIRHRIRHQVAVVPRIGAVRVLQVRSLRRRAGVDPAAEVRRHFPSQYLPPPQTSSACRPLEGIEDEARSKRGYVAGRDGCVTVSVGLSDDSRGSDPSLAVDAYQKTTAARSPSSLLDTAGVWLRPRRLSKYGNA